MIDLPTNAYVISDDEGDDDASNAEDGTTDAEVIFMGDNPYAILMIEEINGDDDSGVVEEQPDFGAMGDVDLLMMTT